MNFKRKNLWIYIGLGLLLASIVLYVAFSDSTGMEDLSIWTILFFSSLLLMVLASIFKSELFNASNKVMAAIPSDAGDSNAMLERFRLGHKTYPRAANIIDEVIKYRIAKNEYKDVRFRAAYIGYNRIVRTNPGDTLFIGPAHKMQMCGGDIIMLGKMVSLTTTELFNFVGRNLDFYNKVMRKTSKGFGINHIFVPSTISKTEYKSICSLAGGYRIDEPTGERFDIVMKIIEDRIDKINDFAVDGWESIKDMQENLTEMLRINKIQSAVVGDANREMQEGGRISEPRYEDRERRENV